MVVVEKPAPRDGLATIPEAARFLSCSRSMVYAMMASNALAYVKLSGTSGPWARRIPWSALERYVAANTVNAVEECRP